MNECSSHNFALSNINGTISTNLAAMAASTRPLASSADRNCLRLAPKRLPPLVLRSEHNKRCFCVPLQKYFLAH